METSGEFPGNLGVSALLASENSLPDRTGSRSNPDSTHEEGFGCHQMTPSSVGTPAARKLMLDDMDSEGSSTNSSPLSDQEDLTESRFFTHEDAQSMYHSAMSEAPFRSIGEASAPFSNKSQLHPEEMEAGEPDTRLPVSGLETLDGPEDSSCDTPKPKSPAHGPLPTAKSPLFHDISPRSLDGEGTDLTSSVTSSQHQPEDQASDSLPTETKTFLTLDELSVWIPWVGGNDQPAPDDVPTDSVSDNSSVYQSQFESMGYKGMPGAFSSDGGSDNRRKERETNRPPKPKSANEPQPAIEIGSGSVFLAENYDSRDQRHDLELEIGSVDGRMDLSAGRLLGLLIQQLLLPPRSSETGQTPAVVNSETESNQDISILLRTKSVKISVMEHLTSLFGLGFAGNDARFPEALLTLEASDTRLSFKRNAMLTARDSRY